MATELPNCGTPAGYQQHQKLGETGVNGCARCRAAQTAYQNEYRREHPDVQARNVRIQNARLRAMRQLAKQFPAELEKLVREELRKDRDGDGPAADLPPPNRQAR